MDVLNAAFKWAIARGELDMNPIAPIKPTLVKRLQKMKHSTNILSQCDWQGWIGIIEFTNVEIKVPKDMAVFINSGNPEEEG